MATNSHIFHIVLPFFVTTIKINSNGVRKVMIEEMIVTISITWSLIIKKTLKAESKA